MRAWFACPLLGLALGFTAAEAGFADFAFLHAALSLDAASGAFPALFLAFGAGVVLAGVGFALFARGDRIPERRLHRGSVPGGLIYGIGWALTGGCPAIVLVQLGQGKLGAIVVVASMAGGFFAARRVKARLELDVGSCGH